MNIFGGNMRTSTKNAKPKRNLRYANNRAYWRLKPHIDSAYPSGHYIGIVDGKIVADAGDFEALHQKLISIEKRIDHRMVVQAGVTYYKKAIDLL
jgi:hypothetical protein